MRHIKLWLAIRKLDRERVKVRCATCGYMTTLPKYCEAC